ncbi:6548_t:CDS:1, partial [Cetraspora pellucida]
PLAKLWQVQDNEIPKLLRIEKNLIQVDEILKPLLDEESFGGTYIDVKTNRVAINTLNFTKADNITSIMRKHINFLSFENVNHSLTTLRHTFNRISELAQSIRPRSISSFIEIKLNKVVIILSHKDDNHNKEFLRAIEVYSDTLNLQYAGDQNPSNPPPMNLQRISGRDNVLPQILSGEGIYYLKTGIRCSAGFWAKSKDSNTNYIVTAGHCSKFGNSAYYHMPWNSPFSLRSSRSFGQTSIYQIQPYDVALINITANIKPTAMIRNTDSEIYKELFICDDIAVSTHGAHLCKSGYGSHVTCGYIRAFNAFFLDDEDNFNPQLTITDMSTINRDSGGPIFYYKQNLRHVSLYGIHIVGGVKSTAMTLPIKIILDEFKLDLLLKKTFGICPIL